MWLSCSPPGRLLVYSSLANSLDEYGSHGARFIPLSWDYKNGFFHSNLRFNYILPIRYEFLKEYLHLANFKKIHPNISYWKNSKNVNKTFVEKIPVYFIKRTLKQKIIYNLKNLLEKKFYQYSLSEIDIEKFK